MDIKLRRHRKFLTIPFAALGELNELMLLKQVPRCPVGDPRACHGL